jgi:excisionase family DNA binding protein
MTKAEANHETALAISIVEAAARLGIGLTTMKKLVWENRIPTFYVGRRRLVPVNALERFVADQMARG